MTLHNLLRYVIWFVLAAGLLLASATPIFAHEEGWRGEYFNNSSLWGGPALVRTDAGIDFHWGQKSPSSRIHDDEFSVRWTRTVYLEAGRYTFTTDTDDGVRLFVDGKLLIDEWRDMARTRHSASIDLGRGDHALRMEYYEKEGDAVARLWWDPTEYPDRGNIITCVRPTNSWIKVYRLEGNQWIDVNPQGWGPISTSGYLKLDGMAVDGSRYGSAGHPYRVELWADGRVVAAAGDTARREPSFRVFAGQDNQTPWGCPAP